MTSCPGVHQAFGQVAIFLRRKFNRFIKKSQVAVLPCWMPLFKFWKHSLRNRTVQVLFFPE